VLIAGEIRARRDRDRPPRVPLRTPSSWRVHRIAVLAAGLCLLPGVISFAAMLTQRSDSALGVRSVEWLRDNGARGLVNRIENLYYSLNAPATGGPALKVLPRQAGAGSASARAESALAARIGRLAKAWRTTPAYAPHAIAPVIRPALPGEGVWHSTFAGSGSRPPVLITSFRPDASYPQLVAGVAWIDHTRTSTWLYPGIQEPAASLVARGPEEVPVNMRSRLVATFNSGFKLADSGGGVIVGGHAWAPMKDGLATIVRYRNGTLDVNAWQGGPGAPADVAYARQNLPLIVDHGRPNPNLSDGPEWGATLGNAIRVWRSSLGVDARGNLLYAAANDQTVGSLAQIMMRAGAVRAMEMDINVYWDSFITYRRPGAIGAANLLPDMARSPQRYLTPDDRDFFAVYTK
jgi:hypothetical protein